MTSAAASSTTPSPATRPDVPAGHYRLRDVLRAEWTKVRSVRSTMWTLGITVVAIIGIGALASYFTAHNWAHRSLQDRLAFDPTGRSLAGFFFGQIALGVLGVLVMSAEYTTGTIRATLAAVPRRPLVLVAKVLVFGVVAIIVAEVASFVAFEVGQQLMQSTHEAATLRQPGVLRAVIGDGLVLVVLGLLALGLASIIRHTAGAIAAFVGMLLVLPLIIQAFPTSVTHAVNRYLPLVIGENMTRTRLHASAFGGGPLFSPWIGFGILCGYTVAILIIGGLLLQRRDA